MLVIVFCLTPDPSPARSSLKPKFCWLERGVKGRGGFAPSQILTPVFTGEDVHYKGVSKRGASTSFYLSPSPNKTSRIFSDAPFGEGDTGGEVKISQRILSESPRHLN
jgi:hypothetical protein